MKKWRGPVSSEPGHCAWCGQKLRYLTDGNNKRYDKAGGYQDDAFCGLRCGYQFGLFFYNDGHRIAVRLEDPRDKENGNG